LAWLSNILDHVEKRPQKWQKRQKWGKTLILGFFSRQKKVWTHNAKDFLDDRGAVTLQQPHKSRIPLSKCERVCFPLPQKTTLPE